jgi:hypothetical protein
MERLLRTHFNNQRRPHRRCYVVRGPDGFGDSGWRARAEMDKWLPTLPARDRHAIKFAVPISISIGERA